MTNGITLDILYDPRLIKSIITYFLITNTPTHASHRNTHPARQGQTRHRD